MTTNTQRRYAQMIRRMGRTVRILPADSSGGIEQRYTGAEEGFIPVKGVFFEGSEPHMTGRGSVEEMRGEADEQRALSRERFLKIAAANLPFVPTETARIVDGETTFAVADVDYEHMGEEIVTYTLLLRVV